MSATGPVTTHPTTAAAPATTGSFRTAAVSCGCGARQTLILNRAGAFSRGHAPPALYPARHRSRPTVAGARAAPRLAPEAGDQAAVVIGLLSAAAHVPQERSYDRKALAKLSAASKSLKAPMTTGSVKRDLRGAAIWPDRSKSNQSRRPRRGIDCAAAPARHPTFLQAGHVAAGVRARMVNRTLTAVTELRVSS